MTEASRTPLQRLNDYLFDQVDVVGQQENNKRMRCKKCNHNFSGYAGRIYDHLISKAGAVRGCTFSDMPPTFPSLPFSLCMISSKSSRKPRSPSSKPHPHLRVPSKRTRSPTKPSKYRRTPSRPRRPSHSSSGGASLNEYLTQKRAAIRNDEHMNRALHTLQTAMDTHNYTLYKNSPWYRKLLLSSSPPNPKILTPLLTPSPLRSHRIYPCTSTPSHSPSLSTFLSASLSHQLYYLHPPLFTQPPNSPITSVRNKYFLPSSTLAPT